MPKRKIQKVIETCYDCEFCKRFESKNDDKAYACVFEDERAESTHAPFLLDLCSNGSHHIPIPENCPLEDYSEPKTEC